MTMATFSCPSCGATFPTEAELKNHAAVHMPGGKTSLQEFTCKACGARFPSEAELSAHERKAHPM
jgi:ribosomal protein L40E